MLILVVDIGGNSVKVHAPGQTSVSFPTPRDMTPAQLIEGVTAVTAGWRYTRVAIGYPGPVRHDQPTREPVNLGTGWLAFDFAAAFGCPVRMLNDAAMQALGSYRGEVMLFMGLGTGLGTALIHDGHIVPLEVAHLPFRDGETFEKLLGIPGLETLGTERWKQYVLEAIELLRYVLLPDYIVLGGGNARRFTDDELPDQVTLGDNNDAFTGGLRMWQQPAVLETGKA